MLSVEELQKDHSLASKFIQDRIGLVMQTIKNYFPQLIMKTDYWDYVQIGCLAMLEAGYRHDTSLGTKFTTYAVPKIKWGIMRYIRDHDGLIRVPAWAKEAYIKYLRLSEQGLSLDEIRKQVIKKHDVSEKTMNNIIAAMKVHSLNANVCNKRKNDSSKTELMYFVKSRFNLESSVICKIEMIDKLRILENFTDKNDKIILRMKRKGKTNKEICSLLNISESYLRKRIKELHQLYHHIDYCYNNNIQLTAQCS